jgi:hypothetical protein
VVSWTGEWPVAAGLKVSNESGEKGILEAEPLPGGVGWGETDLRVGVERLEMVVGPRDVRRGAGMDAPAAV